LSSVKSQILIVALGVCAMCGEARAADGLVSAAPEITVQPSDVTVTDGQPASFSVRAIGRQAVTYHWKQGQAELPGANASTLVIPRTIYGYHNGMAYSVLVSDATGHQVASETATLTIVPRPPVVTEAPLSQAVTVKSTATFSAAATGTLPLTYQWKRNGVPISGASGPSFTTGQTTSTDDESTFTVTVTDGAGETTTSAPAVLTVPASTLAPTIHVDCRQDDREVSHQVTYRRGVVESFDLQRKPAAIVGDVISDFQRSALNFLNATLDINTDPDKSLFEYQAPKLIPSTSGNAPLVQTFRLLGNRLLPTDLQNAVQVSGTPNAYSGHLDPGYEAACGATGNFYPLPMPGSTTTITQKAIETWIGALDSDFPGAIWIGTQEPSHTLGYSIDYDKQGCADVPASELTGAKANNILRYISFWTPIAQYLREHQILSGGIQLNAGDNVFYTSTAQQIISRKMPLDYFTVQDYTPSAAVNQTLYEAYQEFQQNPEYLGVKVILDRYGLSLTGDHYGSTKGMIDFLEDEAGLMPYSDMLYGYDVQTIGIEGAHGPTILPTVLNWLQAAPTPLRPLTSSTSDLHAFALVQKGSPQRAYIAIWNVSSTSASYTSSLVLDGLNSPFTASDLTMLKGSGNSIVTVSNSGVAVSGSTISGLTVNPNEFLLITLQAEPGRSLGGSVISKSGTPNARTWIFEIGNGGADTAMQAQITNVTLQQTHGVGCNPEVTSVNFPQRIGDIPAGVSLRVPITFDFSSCVPTAAFTVTATVSADEGDLSADIVRLNQFQ
jgi:hypothetical protein